VLRVNDGTVDVDQSFSITVSNVNDAPIANNDSATTDEDVEVTINVLENDTDDDGDTLVIDSATATSGTVTINQDYTLTYSPNQDFFGDDTINYTISDGNGESDSATVAVTVNPTDDAPVANADSATVNEDSSVTIDVVANDTDVEETALELLSATALNGIAEVLDNQLQFTPTADFNGQTTAEYVVSDGTNSVTGVVTITVSPVNDAPVVVDDIMEIASSYLPVTINVLDNDSDVDGDAIQLVAATTDFGSVSTTVEGALTYTPIENLTTEGTISYTVTDGTVEVQGKVDVTYEAAEGKPVITVPDDVTVDATGLFTKVDLGTPSAVDKDGNIVPVSLLNRRNYFKPGAHIALWEATDSEGNQSVAAQKVTVNPIVSLQVGRRAPEGSSVTIKVFLNGDAPEYPLAVPFAISGTADDMDYTLLSDSIEITSGKQADINIELIDDGVDENSETIIMTLDESLNTDSHNESTVTIIEPQNVAPVVQIDVQPARIVEVGQSVIFTANVSDDNAADLHAFEWQDSSGQIYLDQQVELFFDTLGVHKIKLWITDDGVPQFDDYADINITVVDTLPTLSDTEDSDGDGRVDALEGLTDSDGDGIPDYLDAEDQCNVLQQRSLVINSYVVETEPDLCIRLGSVSQLSNNAAEITYADIPEGTVSTDDNEANNNGGIFDFEITGLSQDKTWAKVVISQNVPVPVNAVYRKFNENDGWVDFAITDVDLIWSAPGNSGVCPNTGSTEWVEGLNAGDWCIMLQISDGGANDSDQTLNGVIVDPGGVATPITENTLPVAVDDEVVMYIDRELIIDVIENDSDEDNDALTVTSVNALFGTVSINEQNEVVYLPPANFSGRDEVVYGISDGNGGTAYATIYIQIIFNYAPIAENDIASTDNKTPIYIQVLANDTDQNGDDLKVISVTSNYGAVFATSWNMVHYTPAKDFVGEDVLTYVIEDEGGKTSTASVVVTVEKAKKKSSGGSMGWLLLFMLAAMAIRRAKQFH